MNPPQNRVAVRLAVPKPPVHGCRGLPIFTDERWLDVRAMPLVIDCTIDIDWFSDVGPSGGAVELSDLKSPFQDRKFECFKNPLSHVYRSAVMRIRFVTKHLTPFVFWP